MFKKFSNLIIMLDFVTLINKIIILSKTLNEFNFCIILFIFFNLIKKNYIY